MSRRRLREADVGLRLWHGAIIELTVGPGRRRATPREVEQILDMEPWLDRNELLAEASL